jgi:RND family efflux transporter MFP subunit
LTRWTKTGVIVGAIVVVGVILILTLARNAGTVSTPAERGEFTIKIVRSGVLTARRSLTVTAPSVGSKLLITRLVPEGTYVAKGDFLAQFDDMEFTERLESARRELTAARADLDLMLAKNELRKKELDAGVAEGQLALRKAEGGSAADLEKAERDADLAVARRETELKVMEAEALKEEVNIARAEERVTTAEKNIAKLTVTAPGDGIVIHEKVWRGGQQVKVQEGDSPWPGQPIMALPDLSTQYVASDIDETDISRVGVDQFCRITLEAYPDTSFGGHIGTVGNLARSKYQSRGPNVFDISVELDEKDERFRPGMIARVEIIVDVYPDEIFVPIESVFEKEGATLVYVKSGRGFRPREVEVGPRNDSHIIIRSGLGEGDEVALEDPTESGE